MLQNLIARYRIWQVQLDTTRSLDNFDDRLLADMGIERDAIKTVARRNAQAQIRNRAATTACPCHRSKARLVA